MWLTALSALGLLFTSVQSQSCSEESASWVRLKPLDRCKDGEDTCLYSITLSPLTVQLPRSFSELERIIKEVHDLRETVNQLREECRECRERHQVQPGDGEYAGNIQAVKGILNVRETQQDKVNQSAEHESMVIRPVTEIKDPAAITSQPNDNPSAGRQTPVVIKGGKTSRILETMSRLGKVPISQAPKSRPEPRLSKGQTPGQNIGGNRTTYINSVSIAEITERVDGEDVKRKQTTRPSSLNVMDTRLHMFELRKHNHKPEFNVTTPSKTITEHLEDKGIASDNRFKDSKPFRSHNTRKVHGKTHRPGSTYQDVRTMNNQTDYDKQNPAGSDTQAGTELESHRVYTVKSVKTLRSPSSVYSTADVNLKPPPELETKSSSPLKSAIKETKTTTKLVDEDGAGLNNLREADQMDPQRLNDDAASRSETSTSPLSNMRVYPTVETKVNSPGLKSNAEENVPDSDQASGRDSKSAGLKTSGNVKPSFVASRRNLTASRPSSEEIRRFFSNRRSRILSNSQGGNQEKSSMTLINGHHHAPSTSKRGNNLHRLSGLVPFRAPAGEQNPGVIHAAVTELVPMMRSPSSVQTTADVNLKNPPELEAKSLSLLKSAIREIKTTPKPVDVDAASGSNNLREADQMELQRPNDNNDDDDTASLSETSTSSLLDMRVYPTGVTKVNLPALKSNGEENAPDSYQATGRHSNSADLKTSGNMKLSFVASRRNLTASRPSSEEIRRFFLNRRRMNQSRILGGNQETSSTFLTNGQHHAPRGNNRHRPSGLVPFRVPVGEQSPGITELVPMMPRVETSSKRPYVLQKAPENKSVLATPKTSETVRLKGLRSSLNTSANRNTKLAPSLRNNDQGGGMLVDERGNEHNGNMTVILQTMKEMEDQATSTETPTIMERLPVRTMASDKHGHYRTYTSGLGEESEGFSGQQIDGDHSSKDLDPSSKSFSNVPVLKDKIRVAGSTISLDRPPDRYHEYRKPINATEHGRLKNHTNIPPMTRTNSLIVPSDDTDPKKQDPKKPPTPINSVEVGPAAQPQPDVESRNSAKELPPQDCSDFTQKNPVSGIYTVNPTGLDNSPFSVFCDTQTSGGGWTVIQRRVDGTVSFNRTWNDYKEGFGNLSGEFWLGNDKLHRLTMAKTMVLRIELEDLEGIKEHAQYERFHVASESEHYRLNITDYSGTAGNAMEYNKKFNHNQKYFSTPDRDNDHYSSGNCGAYYSSGWWFDACMSANLNGIYHQAKYKGIRKGIFWGTWHNISMESYPTNYRQAFKTVRMMIRPRTGVV